MSGAIGLLAGGVAGRMPESAARLLEIAQKNGERLTLLINDLIDMEKVVEVVSRWSRRYRSSCRSWSWRSATTRPTPARTACT
jgi:signal transduction histidine kinase